jgi:hypothetical protein
MIFEQSLAAIDPIQLAADSGTTKWYPRFRAPIPPVPRPHLLTDQLHGLGCAECAGSLASLPPDYGSLRGFGLGDTLPGDPGTFDMNALQVPSAGTGATSILQTMATGANFIPGIGPIGGIALQTFTQLLNQFQSWFHIGSGRREADMIVPTQNNLMAALGGITNQIIIPDNPTLDVLEGLYRQVWMMGVAFMEFVLQRQFIDRRASGQALNTIMPYIDGSCGYPVPVGFTANPSQFNCLQWGDGTIGGVGSNGMLGAIGRAITAQGGTIQALPNLEMSANSGIKLSTVPMPGGIPGTIMGISTPLLAVGIGVFLLSRKGFFRG